MSKEGEKEEKEAITTTETKQLFEIPMIGESESAQTMNWAMNASPDGKYVCCGSPNRLCTLVERSKISELARDPSSASSKFNPEKDVFTLRKPSGHVVTAPQRMAFSCSGHLLAVPGQDGQKTFDIYDMSGSSSSSSSTKKFHHVFRLEPPSGNHIVTIVFCLAWRPKTYEADKTNICFVGGVIRNGSILMYKFDDPKKSSSQQQEEETSFETLFPIRTLHDGFGSGSAAPAMTITTGFFRTRGSSHSYTELVISNVGLTLRCLSIDESQDFSEQSVKRCWSFSTSPIWIFTILQLNSFEILHPADNGALQITEAMTGNKLKQIAVGKAGILFSGCIFPSRISPESYFNEEKFVDVTQIRGTVAIFAYSEKKVRLFRPYDDSFQDFELDETPHCVALDPQGMFFYTSDKRGKLQVFESPVKKMKDARLIPVFLLREKSKGKMSEAFSIFYVLQLVSVFLPFC